MKHSVLSLFLAFSGLFPTLAWASGTPSVWARVTVLIEPSEQSAPAQNTLIPGGIYTSAEADDLSSIDRQILDRINGLSASILKLEETMRLGTLMVRQFPVELQVGVKTLLPVVDLDPRYRISLTLDDISPQAWGFRAEVQLDKEVGPQLHAWSGEAITLSLQQADLRDVLTTLGKLSGRTISFEPGVKGSVTVDLRDMPWDQALDVMLSINGLKYHLEGNNIVVAPREDETNQLTELWKTEVRGMREPGKHIMIAGPSSVAGQLLVLIEDISGNPPGELEQTPTQLTFKDFHTVGLSPEQRVTKEDALAVVRGTVTEEGGFDDVKILQSPSQEIEKLVREVVKRWSFNKVVDSTLAARAAVVGLGVRLTTAKIMTIPEHLGLDLEVAPGPKSGLFLITAAIHDLDSGRIVSRPRVMAKDGDDAMMRSGYVLPDGRAYSILIEVHPSTATSSLSYSITIQRADQVVHKHTATVRLN